MIFYFHFDVDEISIIVFFLYSFTRPEEKMTASMQHDPLIIFRYKFQTEAWRPAKNFYIQHHFKIFWI
jgi:hypothetical protein